MLDQVRQVFKNSFQQSDPPQVIDEVIYLAIFDDVSFDNLLTPSHFFTVVLETSFKPPRPPPGPPGPPSKLENDFSHIFYFYLPYLQFH